MTLWLVPEEMGHYEPISRSLRIEGYSTSVRLERIFWDVLDYIAAHREVSTCALVGEIYREMRSSGEPLTNFSSVLRVTCLRQLECGAAAMPDSRAAGRPTRGPGVTRPQPGANLTASQSAPVPRPMR